MSVTLTEALSEVSNAESLEVVFAACAGLMKVSQGLTRTFEARFNPVDPTEEDLFTDAVLMPVARARIDKTRPLTVIPIVREGSQLLLARCLDIEGPNGGSVLYTGALAENVSELNLARFVVATSA